MRVFKGDDDWWVETIDTAPYVFRSSMSMVACGHYCNDYVFGKTKPRWVWVFNSTHELKCADCGLKPPASIQTVARLLVI